MTRQELFAFMTSNPTFFLATVEGGKPHVRGLLLYRADVNGIVFHTGKMKDLHKGWNRRDTTRWPYIGSCMA